MGDISKHTEQAIAKARQSAIVADDGDELPDPDTREYIEAERAAARRRVFESAVPALYRSARLEDLHQVHQHRTNIEAWVKSGSKTLILAGPVGTGKTHASYGLLHKAVDAGVRSYGCTLLDLLDSLKPNAAPSPAGRLAVDAELFLFDDVATERATDWAVEQFGGILDHRTREGKRQIITTNATGEELREKFGPRIMSRLVGGAQILTFTGEDLRKRFWG